MNTWDIILTVVLVAVVGCAVIFRVRKRKQGGCGCGCSGCDQNCGMAHKPEHPDGTEEE